MPDQFTLHHHEVQEIMSRMPSWILRWASTGLLLGFGLLTGAAALVRLPDQVPATVRIWQGGAGPGVRVAVPIEQAAAVRPGQRLLIDLQAYPARQYGYLPGTVGQVLPFRSTQEAEVRVVLPRPWRTTTGYAVAPQPLLTGTALITVSESSLLHRIFRY
jgi:hypothetical protein